MSQTNSTMTDQTPKTALVPSASQQQRDQLIALAVNAVDSPHSKRNYRAALNEFLNWHTDQGRPQLTKAVVQAYKTQLQARNLAPSTINVKLSAVRKLVSEAADNGFIDPIHANGIKAVKGAKNEGVRAGNWLTLAQAQQLIQAPDPATSKGKRDRALLAVLLLAGLRRTEAANLTFEHIQMRDNRWVIVDLVGKRGKTRTVPIKAIVKTLIDDWAADAGLTAGFVFRPMRRGDHLDKDRPDAHMSSQAIWNVVRRYCEQLGYQNIAPHDLRRTYAKLAHKGGAAIEQISLNLGHSSIEVTERYLGVDLDLQNAPSDKIDIKIDREQRLPGIDG